MSLNIADFVEQIKTPPGKLTVHQLREREEVWRALWSWTDEEVKYYLLRMGSQVRIVKRDYKGTQGELGAVTFELKELEVGTYEKTYNYTDGHTYYEHKVVKIPAGAIMMREFIQDSVDALEIEQEEIAEFEDDVIEAPASGN